MLSNFDVAELYEVAHIPPPPRPHDESSEEEDDEAALHPATHDMATSTADAAFPSNASLFAAYPGPTRARSFCANTCLNFKWSLYYGAEFTLGGKELTFDVVLYLLGMLFIGTCWLATWTALPSEMSEPAGEVLGPASTIIVCTFFGQYIVARNLGVPAALGVFLTSIVWNHIYQVGFMSRGVFKTLRFIISKVGLTTILVRSGMSLDWKTIKPTAPRTAMLALLPLSMESVLSALMAYSLFSDIYGHDWRWSFLHGIMSSVIAAGLVVPEMLGLIAKGYNKGVPPLVISAVGIDTAMGVWGINFLIQLVFSNQEMAVLAGLGPAQLIGGTLLGVLVAFLFCLLMRLMRRNLWRNPTVMRRFTLAYFLVTALSAVFFGERFSLAGGGTMMALSFATSVGHMLQYEAKLEDKQLEAKRLRHARQQYAKYKDHQQRQLNLTFDAGVGSDTIEMQPYVAARNITLPPTTSSQQPPVQTATAGAEDGSMLEASSVPAFGGSVILPDDFDLNSVPMPPRHHRVAAEQRFHLMLDLRDFWNYIVAGPLYSLAGGMVNLPKLVSPSYLPKGLLIMVCGGILRFIVTGLTVMFGMGWSRSEILFLPMAWLGKGAVQAATGSIALDKAKSHLAALSANATLAEISLAERDVEAGQNIVNTAALYIIVTVPLCSILVTTFAPRLLPKPDVPLNN